MTGEERKQADEFFANQTKPAGILWKLSPEEREVLREVCDLAVVGAWCSINAVKTQEELQKIRQLLGEEK
jgi:hypothetical protein